jgi:hypothetical protein
MNVRLEFQTIGIRFPGSKSIMVHPENLERSSNLLGCECFYACELGEHKSDYSDNDCEYLKKNKDLSLPGAGSYDRSSLFWMKDYELALWAIAQTRPGDIRSKRKETMLCIPHTPRPRSIFLGFASDFEDDDMPSVEQSDSTTNVEGMVRGEGRIDENDFESIKDESDALDSALAGLTISPTTQSHDKLMRAVMQNDTNSLLSIVKSAR